jgi:hypothetical protein
MISLTILGVNQLFRFGCRGITRKRLLATDLCVAHFQWANFIEACLRDVCRRFPLSPPTTSGSGMAGNRPSETRSR